MKFIAAIGKQPFDLRRDLRALVTLRAFVHAAELENNKFLAIPPGAPPAVENRTQGITLNRSSNDPKEGG